MNNIEDIIATDTYKNHVIKMAMCDFGKKAPTMYYDEKPVIICSDHENDINNVPDKHKNDQEAMNIYNDLINLLKEKGYLDDKPEEIRKAYGIKSYYELYRNNEFTKKFNRDKEAIKRELEPIQKRIESCEAFAY